MTTTTITTTPATETVPTTWTAVDELFFRITADLFPQDVVFAAGVLLASYDQD